MHQLEATSHIPGGHAYRLSNFNEVQEPLDKK